MSNVAFARNILLPSVSCATMCVCVQRCNIESIALSVAAFAMASNPDEVGLVVLFG